METEESRKWNPKRSSFEKQLLWIVINAPHDHVFEKSSQRLKVNAEIWYYRRRTVERVFSEFLHILIGAQYRHCNYCLKSDAATCAKCQRNQICATDPDSFGTSHCASAVVKYEDGDGRVQSGFMRGCINCASRWKLIHSKIPNARTLQK